MTGGRFWRTVAVAALLLGFLVGGTAMAGTTGKITGTVTDAQGNPLPGANVVIGGTKWGATTDAEGVYFLLAVDPGVYTLTASMIGYNSQKKIDVKVVVDWTTAVNFKLVEAALEMEEIVVTAERPPVEPDKTSSKYVISKEDIEQIPIVRSAEGLVQLQAGAALDGSRTIRGGSGGQFVSNAVDVTYYMDGVRLVNNDTGAGTSTAQFTDINRMAIQEITVISGGIEAEYGNAQGGIVNIVTRDGGRKFHGQLDYKLTAPGRRHWGPSVYDVNLSRGEMKWDDPDWANELDPKTGRLVHQRSDYDDLWGQYLEGSLSGPIADRLTFFISSRWNHQPASVPSASVYTPFNTNNTYKLSYQASENLRIKVGGVYKQWKGFGPYGRSPGTNVFLPAGRAGGGEWTQTENVAYVAITHSLSPKTVYELRVSRYATLQDTSNIPDRTADTYRKDKDGVFAIDFRPYRSYTYSERTRYGVKFDLSSQRTGNHFVKTGFDFTFYNVRTVRERHLSSTYRYVYVISGKPGDLHTPVKPIQGAVYLQDKMEFEGLIVNAGLRYDFFYHNQQVAAVKPFAPMYNRMTRYRKSPTTSAGAIHSVSPRIGVSHPITDRSSIHFFYGHFYQIPTFWILYAETWRGKKADRDVNGNGTIDETEKFNGLDQTWAWGQPDAVEKTISYEVGADWNFVADYTAGLVFYHKAGDGQVASSSSAGWARWKDPKAGALYTVRTPAGGKRYEVIRGFELSVRKAFSHNFAFNAAYNLQWYSEGWHNGFWFFYPDSSFVVSDAYGIHFKANSDGTETFIPLNQELTPEELAAEGHKAQEVIRNHPAGTLQYNGVRQPLEPVKGAPGVWSYCVRRGGGLVPKYVRGYDVRNTAKMQIVAATPPDFGPAVKGGIHPLGDLQMNLIYRMYTGITFRYTPFGGGSRTYGKAPIHTGVDLNVQKTFNLSDRIKSTFFVEVYNLFNQKDFRARSGSQQPAYLAFGLDRPAPDDPTYLQYGYVNERSDFQGAPRRVDLGLRLFF